MDGCRYLAISVLFMSLLTACSDENGMTEQYMEVPDGYGLSAGTSTVFMNTSFAYDSEAPWVTGSYLTRFNRGDNLYDNIATVSKGLGPVYGGYSCGSCHHNAGRTTPAVWSGGSGSYGFSSMLVYVARKNGKFFQDYGRVLHDQSIYGVKAEGKLHAEKHTQNFSFPDGEPYSLTYFTYTITDWYADSIRPEDLFCSVRAPLRHVGQGQIMALDHDEIEALAARSNYPEYGISGRCNYITEKGKYQLGLGGNKANHADLTVELGFSSDLGVTNSRYPEEVCRGQAQIAQGSMMGLAYDRLDVSTEEMEDVDLYMQCLGVPARRNVNDPVVQRGEQMFYKAKCHLCHVTTLHTRPMGSTLLNGTRIPWVGGQTIHPYSDFLLHDMGSEIMGVGLNDHFTAGLARGNEWRTTPLWGIGLQYRVNGHNYFLHDGRADGFVEAIMWHGGEGEASKNLFRKMPKADRDALVKFLESL
ncbi:MAG: thiol oxidoreductase [Paludibacteraceae bacterium]|nr:thiol oxidoreductase [Paludibacteraceae bacterium]